MRTIWMNGVVANRPHLGPWAVSLSVGRRLGQTDFDEIPAEAKRDVLRNLLDESQKGYGKTLEIVRSYGGLGDRLSSILGADYGAFIALFQPAVPNKIARITAVVNSNDTAVLSTLTGQDEQDVTKWGSDVAAMNAILMRHVSQQPQSLPLGTVAIASAGLVGVGALLYALL